MARVAGELELHRHGRLQAVQRVLERDAHFDLDVVAALAALLPPPVPAAVAEEAAEHAAEVEIAEVEVHVAGGETALGPPVRRPEAVVALPLLRVGEDVVRGLNLLEPRLRRLVAGVPVRVDLAHELAIRLLDLGRRRVLLHAQRLVEGLSHQLLRPQR